MKIKWYIFFALLAILAFWPVSFLQMSLKYDVVDGYLPLRFFVGECLQNYIFPFWHPYQSGGYPIHAGLIEIWYPEILITGKLFGYTIITMHVWFVAYISLAGIGFYKLAKRLGADSLLAFGAGAAYMFSGYMVGNAQHFNIIVGAALLPWAIYYYHRFSAEPNWQDLLKTCIILFLFITGAYPAQYVMLFYLLLALFLYRLVAIFRENKVVLKPFLMKHAIMLVLLLTLCSGLLMSFMQVQSFVGRFSGLNMQSASTLPFSPQCSVSMLFPFSVVKNLDFFNTDLSMTNVYFGIFMLLGAGVGLFYQKGRKDWLLLFLAVFCLMFSFGTYTPIFKFMFQYVPGFNLFRMSSVMRIYFILFLLLFTARQLSKADFSGSSFRKLFTKLVIITGSIIAVLVAISLTHLHFSEIKDIIKNVIVYSDNQQSTIYGHIAFQGIIQLGLLLAFIVLMRICKPDKLKLIFVSLVVIDLLIAVQLNLPYTVVYKNSNPVAMHQWQKSLPVSFPIPDKHYIADNADIEMSFMPLYMNTSTYYKTPSADGYSLLMLSQYELSAHKSLEKEVWKNPLVFLSSKVYSNELLNDTLRKIQPSDLYFDSATFAKIVATNISGSKNDTIWISHFSPNKIELKVITDSAKMLCLLQNYYPGWKVYIDSVESDIYKANFTFMATKVPAGNHSVMFVYQNTSIKFAFIIGNTLLVLLILVLIILYVRKWLNHRGYNVVVWLIVVSLIYFLMLYLLFFASPSVVKRCIANEQELKSELKNVLQSLPLDSVTILMNVDDCNKYQAVLQNYHCIQQGMRLPSDRGEAINKLLACKTPYVAYAWSNLKNSSEFTDAFKTLFSIGYKEKRFDKSGIIIGHRGVDTTMFCFSSINEGEPDDHSLWSKNPGGYSDLHSTSGKYSMVLDSLNIYSSTFSMPLEKICKKPFRVLFMVDAYMTGNAKASLVIQLDQQGKTVMWESVDIKKFEVSPGMFSTAFMSRDIEPFLNKADMLKAYILYSGESQKLYIDRLRLFVFENN